MTPTSRAARVLVHRLTVVCALILTFGLSAEVTARLEDRIRLGVPLLVVPDHDRDLIVRDELGIRGRPNGRFKKWRLNQFGFRGVEVSMKPSAACGRILVLGASESFGMYEASGHEYPAQLEALLKRTGCFEVLNAAVTGLGVPAIAQLWTNWASQFEPDVVVVYPTPAFYLGDRAPHPPRVSPEHPESPPPSRWTSRLLDRARDRFQYPEFLQRRRVVTWRQRELAAARAGHDESWLFATVPPDRLDQFVDDVDRLVTAVERAGAIPVVVTHGTGFHRPLQIDEADALDAWNVFAPRALEEVLLPFEDATTARLRELASRRRVPLVDAASRMNGRHEWFADDLIHFSDEGAAEMARLLAAEIVRGHWPGSSTARRLARGQQARSTVDAVQ